MSAYSPSGNRCKYSVYLSEFFQSLEDYKDIVEHINQAGMIHVSVEKGPGIHTEFEKALEQGMADADIFILYLGNGIEGSKYKGMPVIELEYDCAKKTEKAILVYLSSELNVEDPEMGEFIEEIKEDETYRIIHNDAELPSILLMDLMKTMLNNPGLSFWVRSDISPAKVDSIAQQKTHLVNNLLQAGYYIQLYEKNIESQQRDQIIGPLIDIELRPNISGQAYCFAVKQKPNEDLKHDELKYLYCIDRFMPYEGGAVYDRLLDMTWLIISDQNFSWLDALDWKNKLNPQHIERVKASPPSQHDGELNEWRLPTIEELMTLITVRRMGEDYLDKVFFSGDVHWFWSSTSTKDQKKAYYIETTQGSVLRDELDHMNAIFLCCNGKAQKLGGLVHIPKPLTPGRETEILRDANRSRHIYGVFVAIYKDEHNDGSDLAAVLQNTLHKAGYLVECNLSRSSQVVLKEASVLAEIKNQDAYILVLDRTALPQMLERARRELRFARNFNLPILLFHNYQDYQPGDWKEKLELSREEILGLSRYKDVQRLAADLVPALNRCLEQSLSSGWIRNHAFDVINSSIETINYQRSLLESSEPLLKAFIDSCKVQGLEDAFEKSGIIAEKPSYGEQTWFASSDNPIQRFFPQEAQTRQIELPILFEKLPNRFKLAAEGENLRIVYDQYLKLKWWTLGVKKVSFEEALAYARQVSQQQKEEWRVPTIEEMATLITRSRINRKYMDEKIFPRGRWFWTASRIGDEVYYIDYNYLQGAIRQEDLSLFTGEFPMLRKKSVILVCSESQDRETNRPIKKPQPAQKGVKIVDPTSIPILIKAVDILYDQVSKILTERRERRNEQAKANLAAKPEQPQAQTLAKLPTKEEMLRLPLKDTVWADKRQEVARLTEILQTYTENYYLAKNQIAMWGKASVPPIKIHELEDAENGIAETSQKLEKVLSAIYGTKIGIPDWEE